MKIFVIIPKLITPTFLSIFPIKEKRANSIETANTKSPSVNVKVNISDRLSWCMCYTLSIIR